MGEVNFDEVVGWFNGGGALKIQGDERSDLCLKGFRTVPGLVEAAVAGGLADRNDVPTLVGACELILEGLAEQKLISRSEELGYIRARPERKDPMGGYGKGLNLG
jgi:hypothetical protein